MNSKATESFTFIAPAKNYTLVLKAAEQVYVPSAHAPSGFDTRVTPGLRVKFEGGRFRTDDPYIAEQIMQNDAFNQEVFLLTDEALEDPKDKKIRELEAELEKVKGLPGGETKSSSPKKSYTASDGTVFDHPLKVYHYEKKLKKQKAPTRK